MPKVRATFLSYFPGGMQAAPEWSSDSGLAASALLERELTARFVGGAFTTDTPVADVRRAHLLVLSYWTSAQLWSQAVSRAFVYTLLGATPRWSPASARGGRQRA